MYLTSIQCVFPDGCLEPSPQSVATNAMKHRLCSIPKLRFFHLQFQGPPERIRSLIEVFTSSHSLCGSRKKSLHRKERTILDLATIGPVPEFRKTVDDVFWMIPIQGFKSRTLCAIVNVKPMVSSEMSKWRFLHLQKLIPPHMMCHSIASFSSLDQPNRNSLFLPSKLKIVGETICSL